MGRTHDITISGFDLDRIESELEQWKKQANELAIENSKLKSQLSKSCKQGNMTLSKQPAALLRTCDICGEATAIDLDPTPEIRKEMHMNGQTITELPTDAAMAAWEYSGRCRCDK